MPKMRQKALSHQGINPVIFHQQHPLGDFTLWQATRLSLPLLTGLKRHTETETAALPRRTDNVYGGSILALTAIHQLHQVTLILSPSPVPLALAWVASVA